MGGRGRRTGQEEELQEPDGVRDLDRALVVAVHGVLTERSGGSQEEVREDAHRIGDVHQAVGVGVAADEALPSIRSVDHAGSDGAYSAPLYLSQDRTVHHGDVIFDDLTGDGREDLLVAAVQQEGALLWPANGGRSFGAPRSIPVGLRPLMFREADLDGDGLPDLIACGAASQSITVCLNRGGTEWAPPTSFWTGFLPLGHRIADFDGDGALDALVYGSSRAMILPGVIQPGGAEGFLRGDADGDRRLALNDAIVALGRLFFGAGALTCEDAADADDDGALGVTDPIATLNHLFLGAGPLPPPSPERCGGDPTPDGLTACGTQC